jgi:hypothetical protein
MRALCAIFSDSSHVIRIMDIVTEPAPWGNLKNSCHCRRRSVRPMPASGAGEFRSLGPCQLKLLSKKCQAKAFAPSLIIVGHYWLANKLLHTLLHIGSQQRHPALRQRLQAFINPQKLAGLMLGREQ